MTADEFADALFDSWNDVYGYADDIDLETFRTLKISKLVPETAKFTQAGPLLDRIFVERVRDELRARATKVAAFTPSKYRGYRKSGKTWDELATWMAAAQSRP